MNAFLKWACFITAATALLSACDTQGPGPDPDDEGQGQNGPQGKYPVPVPEVVDLGLSVKWASCNLGASSPEKPGYHYAWGETEPKDDFSWSTYAYASGDNSHTLTKYCPKNMSSYWDGAASGPDGLTKLQPGDDAAHVKLGGKWRLPTLDELNELIALKSKASKPDSDYTWEQSASITDSNGSSFRGIRITRKSTGATLFLPIAKALYDRDVLWGDTGCIWSSNLNEKDPSCVFYMQFFATVVGCGEDGSPRNRGLSIRPVTD